LSIWPAIQRFIAELQRRKVLRVASAYVVAGWVVLQVAATIENTLNLPASFDTAVFVVMAAALPIVLIAAWRFDITPQGIRRTEGGGDGTLATPGITDMILVAMLVMVGLVAVGQTLAPSSPVEQAAPIAEPAPSPAAAVDPKSIAVLPFVNMTTDKANEYFSDGLTEEILNLLAQVADLKVISRTSSFAFKGKSVPLPDVARQLGVRHILEGSVRRANDQVRVTAQLIDVTTDAHLWSKTFDRKAEDIFAVQDEIARAIASALRVEVGIAAASRDAPTKNIAAYRLFLKARELYRERGDETVLESIELYKQAIALDPDFAEAHAGLAASYTSEGSRTAEKFAEYAPLAIVAANRAIALKDSLSQPHAVLGSIACDRLRWSEAYEKGRAAVARDPSDSNALLWLGITELAARRIEDASVTLDRAARVDPLFTFIDIWRLRAAFARRDIMAGTQIAEKLVRTGPEGAVSGLWYLAYVAKTRGDLDLAEKHFREAMRIIGAYGELVDPIVRAMRSPDAVADATALLKAEVARDESFNPDLVYLLIGDTDSFFEMIDERLTKGDTTRVVHMLGLAWGLPKSAWAQSAKAQALMKSAGLIAYWRRTGAPDRCEAEGLEGFNCN
jgi:TolB-like protein/Tfp pilus assembly protein PilF